MDNQTRRRLGIAIVFGSLTMAILLAALWGIYRTTQRDLENELSRRLEQVAIVLAADLATQDLQSISFHHSYLATQPDSQFVFLTLPSVVKVRRKILDLNDEINVANITLYDSVGTALLDFSTEYIEAGLEVLNLANLLEAVSGSPTHTSLYRSGDQFLMTGFAPIEDEFGDIYVLGIDGGVEFFDGLRRLRGSLMGIAGICLTLMIIMSLVFVSLQTRLVRAETLIHRSETLAAMGRMTAGIAHEIRNPLGIIRATASRLRKSYDNVDAPDDKFTYIEDEVDRLDAILTGYLNLAKDDEVRLETTDLPDLVHRTLHHLASEFEKNSIAIETQLGERCSIQSDPQRIQQLLLNLVLNSVQAMEKGGRILFKLTQGPEAVTLSIQDDGPGFPAEVLKRAFEPFFTTKEKGSGLGLTVVQRIIEQHQASIQLRNIEPHGALIEIRFRTNQA